MISKSAFAAADVDCSKFPHVSEIEDPDMSSVRSTRIFGTTLTMLSSVVGGIRMLLDA